MPRLEEIIKLITGVIPDFKLPENIDISNNKVDLDLDLSLIKNNKTYEIKNNTIIINVGTPEGVVVSREIFKNAENLLEPKKRIVERGFGGLISQSKPFVEPTKEDLEILKRVKTFAPQKDMPIIHDALFIRRLFKNNISVDQYKVALIKQYGSRGNNIANLMSVESVGYFEEYLPSIQKHLQSTESPDEAARKFAIFYEDAVTLYPFAVFVSVMKPYAQIKKEVRSKIKLNISNEQHSLNLHGIGPKNKNSVKKLLHDSDISNSFLSAPDVLEPSKAIFAKIYF